uniref:Uncharacterized protein n=1 Tax=viral metagenome TaxID=1070528 RepID=A0A6C0DT30_9ZZZZ
MSQGKPTPVSYQTRQPQSDTQRVFFSSTNYARVLQPLREQYEKRLNRVELPDDVDKRLQKTLQHYMGEVFRINGPSASINMLNQESFRETSMNTDAWLARQTSAPVTQTRGPVSDSIFESVGNRFEREQQSRAPPPAAPGGSVNFAFPQESEEENEDPLEKYERIRKLRDAETKAAVVTTTPNKPRNDILSEPSAPTPTTVLPALQNNNPPAPPLLAPRPQDYVIKQEDVVKYREIESNLYIYSGDRDWLNNRAENRYNFTVAFNPANNSNTATFSPSVKERFKNIVRMELVKVIFSAESLGVTVRQVPAPSGTTVVSDTGRILNVLNYPYLMVRLNEWTGNGYGTNANIDNTFGLIQYDQTWKSDPKADNVGYISMTPRYLKAQRVYAPTPLATLQKLSITLESPDGNPLTSLLDTVEISRIYLAASTAVATAPATSVYSSNPNTESYIFIATKAFFSRFSVAEGDTIQIRGYDVGIDTNVTPSLQNEFNSFINRGEGHVVVGTAWGAGEVALPATPPVFLTDGSNSVGYCNYIVIRSRFADPTTGSTARNYFGGGGSQELLIKTRLEGATQSTNAAALNRNRQSHLTIRVITREMDYGSNVRPDNT